MTFWALSMYDLHVPHAAYDKQTQQLKAQIAAIDENDLVCFIFHIYYKLQRSEILLLLEILLCHF